MNYYEITFGGKTDIIKGANLVSALEDYGFTDIFIVPLWRGTSNGTYNAYCCDTTTVFCQWVDITKKP